VDRVERSLVAGLAALKDWKNAASRRREPRELTPREIWTDFLAADLDDGPRAVLAGDGPELLHEMTPLISAHRVREGVRDLLAAARDLGIPVGIVSNAHSGRSHRALLRDHGLEGDIAVQVYSDEVGIRKPHPGMIELAAAALGTEPARTWYVGDTHDRDLVAGRRAGVGAVVLTRSQHTDRTPYPVAETPDVILDDPRGLVPLLHAARPVLAADDPVPTPVPRAASTTGGRPAGIPHAPAAVLLDHGGVISSSTKDPQAQRAFAETLANDLQRAGHHVTTAELVSAFEAARFRHKEWKHATHRDGAEAVPEIDPRTLWEELTGADLPAGARAWLAAEAHRLSHEFALIKSRVTLRPGMSDVFAVAREHGIRIAIVSNTVSGRAVRDRLRGYGLLDQVAASVYSDELGRRKPDPAMPAEAVRALGVLPSDCWFVGDKPDRDMLAARGMGIGTIVLVRGGSTPDDAIDTIGDNGDARLRPDVVLPDLGALADLLSAAIRGDAVITPPPLTIERTPS
jgi:HAD superfamily hydrolase (TIGR01509 family)